MNNSLRNKKNSIIFTRSSIQPYAIFLIYHDPQFHNEFVFDLPNPEKQKHDHFDINVSVGLGRHTIIHEVKSESMSWNFMRAMLHQQQRI